MVPALVNSSARRQRGRSLSKTDVVFRQLTMNPTHAKGLLSGPNIELGAGRSFAVLGSEAGTPVRHNDILT